MKNINTRVRYCQKNFLDKAYYQSVKVGEYRASDPSSRFATHRTSRSTDVMENVSYTCPIERVEKIAVDAHMLAMNQYSTRGGGAVIS